MSININIDPQIITALSTIAAIAVTHWANICKSKTDAKHAYNIKIKELKYQKIEELYYLFEQWEKAIDQVCLAHYSCFCGNQTHPQTLIQTKEIITSKSIDYTKIKMLISLYANEALDQYSVVDEKRSQLTPFYQDPQKSKLSLASFDNACDEFTEACNNFKAKLAEIAAQSHSY